jgi:hypothetical protein
MRKVSYDKSNPLSEIDEEMERVHVLKANELTNLMNLYVTEGRRTPVPSRKNDVEITRDERGKQAGCITDIVINLIEWRRHAKPATRSPLQSDRGGAGAGRSV